MEEKTWNLKPIEVVNVTGPTALKTFIGPFAYNATIQYYIAIQDMAGNVAEASPEAYTTPHNPLENLVMRLNKTIEELRGQITRLKGELDETTRERKATKKELSETMEELKTSEREVEALGASLRLWQYIAVGTLIMGLATGIVVGKYVLRRYIKALHIGG